eukprot:GGOE01032846.1.p1 GENE.GGOE01032846.1~~GGOE01032846.1.p1  ORF type:complete len:1149 (-),score=348.61 GGOE01032846.1:274-3678(-)
MMAILVPFTFLLQLTFHTLTCSGANVDISLISAGGTLPDPVYKGAIFAYTLVRPNVTISYSALGSVPGQCHIMATPNPAKCSSSIMGQPLAVDFATSDVPLEAVDYQLNPDLQMYPTVATAVVPVYHLNATANLTLSTAVLGQIFSGQILTWDDPRIVSLNPNFTAWRVPAGQRIEVVVRDSGSGTTGVFRQALCYFDDVFASQVGPGTDANWTGVAVTQTSWPQAYVTVTPYTISYISHSVAVDYQLPMVTLMKRSGAVVKASMETLGNALLEMDLSLLQDSGEDPSNLMVELVNAKSNRTWPIAAFTYILMRSQTLRPGASCSVVQETVAFWVWFWTSDTVARIMKTDNFSPLPEIAITALVSRVAANVRCGGQPVLHLPQPVVLHSSGVGWVAPIFKKFNFIYPNATVSYRSDKSVGESDIEQRLDSDAFVATHLLWTPSAPSSSVRLILGGIAVVIISQYNLTLDLPTLTAILDGKVTTWLSPALLQINGGFSYGVHNSPTTDPSERIVLLGGPTSQDPFLADLIRASQPGFTGAALAAASQFPTEAMLRSAVSATPFSMGVSVMVGSFNSNLRFAHLIRADGAVVAPSWQSVQACATADVYNAATLDLRLQQSTSPDCYPLASTVYIAARKSQCNDATDPEHTAAVYFLEWLLLHPFLAEALRELQVAPLPILPNVDIANRQVLDLISCRPRPPPFPQWMFTVAGVCAGVVVILGAAAAVCVWKSTADVRALRRQFANDNVAHECAAAIASFDLEAVEWLKTLEKPNHIQKSFLQIIRLLTEVRPFIPDQLLSSLQRKGTPEESDGPTHGCGHRLSAGSDSSSFVASTCNQDTEREGWLPSPKVGSSPRRRSPRSAARCNVYASQRMEWRRKLGVFMYVRFAFLTTTSADFLPQRMASLLVNLVTIAKAHGATIDHVAYGSLALHWGVAFGTAQGPLKAATAALEMTQRTHCAEGDGEDLQLRIGLAYGMCDVSTASAAAHSFFIVAGPEVQTAMDMVAQDAMAGCKCEVLLTHALHREVEYVVECMPRLWFGEVLLWEPRRPQQYTGSSEEWMYELQNIEVQQGRQFSAKLLHAVFMMARCEASRAQVQAEAQRLRELYATEMTVQDVAALQHLEAATTVEAWRLSAA